MTLEIRPLTDALGAEVIGLDPNEQTNSSDTAALRDAFGEYHLLCFRLKPLPTADFAAFSRRFGEPQDQLIRNRRHEGVAEVSILDSTYAAAEDKPDDLRLKRLTGWHTDDSYFESPAKATLLQSIAIPDRGGQTRFCNTQKAYEDLPAAEKTQLDDLQAVHGYDTARTPATATVRTQQEIDETPEVVHPLIRTNEDTGARAIYFNANRTDRIVDMARDESNSLLDRIHDRITQPRYRYDHEWRVGDLLIWDNQCLVHSVNMDFPVGQKRLHQRILLKGGRPV